MVSKKCSSVQLPLSTLPGSYHHKLIDLYVLTPIHKSESQMEYYQSPNTQSTYLHKYLLCMVHKEWALEIKRVKSNLLAASRSGLAVSNLLFV